MAEKTTLLIVDDDQDIHDLITRFLSDKEYIPLHAYNGQAAIDMLDRVEPDLIILDVIMPGLDGFETCLRIRQSEIGEYIPIIVMTANDDADSINRAYESGATDFITKPFNPVLLSHKIRFLMKAKETADQLRETQHRLETAQRIAKLGHWEWVLNNNKLCWSAEICQIMGYPASKTSARCEEVLSRFHPEEIERVRNTVKRALKEKKPFNIELRLLLPDKTSRTVQLDAEVFCDDKGHAEKVVGTLQDITRRKKTEDKIKTLAYYNKVTGLPNRTLLKRLLNKYLKNSRSGQNMAVLTITLDRFKLITDSYGHAFGENLIRKVAIRLIRSLKDSPYLTSSIIGETHDGTCQEKPLTIAHCDGNEFVVILPHLKEADDAAIVARNINRALAIPYRISDQEIRTTVSIGISIYPADGKSTDLLLKNSATALYHAKRKGGDGYKFYTEKMNTKAFERLTLETSLRKAIDEKEFVLFYQPKITLSNLRLVGMETLLRWEHPELGTISPDEFINIIEKTGLIIQLGERIIESACMQLREWIELGYRPIPIAINLSPVQLRQKDFHLRLSKILKRTGVKPQLIELEITESTLMNNMDRTINMLKKLRLLGTRISIDDFGTGYSSLTYLKHFPVNTLKIDRSFIKNVTTDPDDSAIVKGVIALAHSLQLDVIAEGIEDKEQLEFLKEAECDYGQGYYFSKPLDKESFTRLFLQNSNSGNSKSNEQVADF